MELHKVGYKRYKNIEEHYNSYLEDNKLSESTKKILRDWINERKANGFKDRPTIGLLGTMINITKKINKDVLDITKEDLQNLFSKSSFTETQELWYKKCLKRFYYWLSKSQDNIKYLAVINWIDTKRLSSKCSQRAMKKREDNLLTPEEVRKMISKATTLRDKLLISLIADTGVRAESIGASYHKRSINVGQIEFKKGYAIIHNIEEKFDKRRDVIVTESLSYLIKYWNELPEDYKKDPKNSLFFQYAKNRYGQRLGYAGLKRIIQLTSKEAIGRIVNPHDFRHLKGTRLQLDDNLSDDSKCKLMGWSSRRMLDRYSHITFDDARKEYLEKKGIIVLDKDNKTKVEASILRPKECLVCHNINSFTDTICEKCGNTLNYEQIIQDYANRGKYEEKLNKFMDLPEVQELYKLFYKLEKRLETIEAK